MTLLLDELGDELRDVAVVPGGAEAARGLGRLRSPACVCAHCLVRKILAARSIIHHICTLFLKLSVGLTGQVYLLEIEGLFTQGSRPGRTVGGLVGGIFGMDRSDWSNGNQYQVFDTRPDTDFKLNCIMVSR